MISYVLAYYNDPLEIDAKYLYMGYFFSCILAYVALLLIKEDDCYGFPKSFSLIPILNTLLVFIFLLYAGFECLDKINTFWSRLVAVCHGFPINILWNGCDHFAFVNINNKTIIHNLTLQSVSSKIAECSPPYSQREAQRITDELNKFPGHIQDTLFDNKFMVYLNRIK